MMSLQRHGRQPESAAPALSKLRLSASCSNLKANRLPPRNSKTSCFNRGPEGSIRLRDVATVREGAGTRKIGDATIMGKAGVLLLISSQYGANTIEVTQGLEKAIEDLRPGLNSDGITLRYPDLFRPANFIATSSSNH